MPSSHTNSTFGILWMLLFCLSVTISDGIVRYITINGLDARQVLFFGCFVGTVLLLPLVIIDRSVFINTKTFKIYLLRGMFAFFAIISWFWLLQYVNFTTMIAINLIAPLFTVILAIIFLGESRAIIKTISLFFGFCGAIVVIKPFTGNINYYAIFAVRSVLMWSISLIFAKLLAENQKPVTISFFLFAIMLPFSCVIAIPVWQWPNGEQWNYLFLFVLFGTLGQIALAKAFSNAPLTTLMPLEYSSLIFAAILSYFLFEELVTTNTLIGGAIIVCSSYLILYNEKIKDRDFINK